MKGNRASAQTHLLLLACCSGLLAVAAFPLLTRVGDKPPPPVWPPSFITEFTEQNTYGWLTYETKGTYLYDSFNARERIDREDGRGDRYCGFQAPFHDTPCSHLVVNGTRYLIFPGLKSCCQCCTEEAGCGVLDQGWLTNATYLGMEPVDGVDCYKWNQPGLQNNYYWQAADGTPAELYQSPNDLMKFNISSFNLTFTFHESSFELPEGGCTELCMGTCAVVRRGLGWRRMWQ